MSLPVVAIVGRPNVGKSTLTNRFIGRREAIVSPQPGVTRDRVGYRTEWRGRPFFVVDTGGLDAEPFDPLAGKVSEVAKATAAEADVVVFLVDVTAGVTPADREVADVVRRLDRPVVLVVNKVDDPSHRDAGAEFFELGLGEPHAVSALHGSRSGDLLDVITASFPEATDEEEETTTGIAIIGRPNVGKSTLFNRLTGGERSIVHSEPGTTRDAVDTVVEREGIVYRFVDTAGLRRASRVDEPTEFYGTVRTMRALERCDVALLVVDGTEALTRQDLRIATEIVEAGRSAVVVLNKIDDTSAEEREERRAELGRRLPHLEFAPRCEVSALSGKGVERLWPVLTDVLGAREVRIPTPLLNAVVQDAQGRTPIPGRRVRYAVQAEIAPPTIVLFGATEIPVQWLRYLERTLRHRFGFEGTPIRFVTRSGRQRRTG